MTEAGAAKHWAENFATESIGGMKNSGREHFSMAASLQNKAKYEGRFIRDDGQSRTFQR
jgi:hypothetical protein